ncbi:Protein ACCELERATED CELL DEATH 6 [Camellia lanceoleosa]|uniref:Protein ACCELERATED CELL DEATH 6 n=1 Tax=Camellia lanceoleosa TaxID=1840588 RepID=A0ACC0FXA3_9ERIC|nr:Protein ACCELERATED CELL DEATH 6 [Camellia lanceoleosa]
MACLSMEGFVGNGALKRVLPKLIEEGWDDVPTLKLMKPEDMDAINMTQQQKDALEMRSYLHECALIQYGDKLESSGKCLSKLLGLSTDEISSQFGMKRGHIARFMEKITANYSAPDPLQQPPYGHTSESELNETSKASSRRRSVVEASKMDPELYREAMGSKENKCNNDDVFNYMRYINGQQLELQFTSNKNTVLHVAAQFGKQKYVTTILKKRPSLSLLHCLNIDRETSLHIAVREGHFDIVKALIEYAKRLDHEEVESGGGAAKEMLRAPNKDNDTALHMAVRNPRNLDMVEWLTKEDLEFTHLPNNAKETPLYLAAERQHNDMVFMILKNCTSPAYGGPKGQTALHAAASHSWKTESTTHLLKKKPDLIKKTDDYGWIPLHYAARYGNEIGVSEILKIDKSVAYITTDEKDDEKTALHIAAAQGNVCVMEELLSQCPDCWEIVNSKGQNILHIALDMEQKKVIKCILEKAWIIHLINQKDIEGNTPLHLFPTVFWDNMLVQKWKLWNHFSGDQKALNNKNETPKEIQLSHKKDSFHTLRRISGRNIVRMDQDLIPKLKKTRRENREKRKVRLEENNRRVQTHLIVATLIATVTFAAGFTMPGGYDGNQGPKQGMPVLLRTATFQVFVITNTIAMICSISAGFLYASASFYNEVKNQEHRHLIAFWLILVAMGAMVVAFITGTFTMLSHSLGVAITVCIVGSFSFFIFIPEVFKLYDYEYITDPDSAIISEEIRIMFQDT